MSESQSPHWTLNIENIESYLMHQLPDAREQEFTDHIQHCEECRLRVQSERELLAGIRRYGRAEMKRRMQHRLRREQGRRFEWTHAASLAAAVILMLAAVFTLRWFTDIEQSKTRGREIAIRKDEAAHRSLWITGRVTVLQRTFRGKNSNGSSPFVLRYGNITQTVSIKHARTADLPQTMRADNPSIVHALLEQTSKGLQLTLYTDASGQSPATGIEAVSADTFMVYLSDRQMSFSIPGGWAGTM